jgi:hypothetical protein
MRKLLGIAIASAVVASVTVAGVALASADSGNSHEEDTIVVTAKSDKTIQIAQNQPGGTGDEIVLNEKLFQGNSQVGFDDIVCTQTPEDSNHFLCNGAFTFTGKGQITVDGAVNFSDPKPVVPIVGGSGQFFGARGQFDFVSVDATTFTDTFHLAD